MIPRMNARIRVLTKRYFEPLAWVLAIFFLIEEAIWDWTSKQMARLGTIRLINWIESKISKATPYWALFIFALPSLILNPAEIIGMKAISSGHWIIGGLVFVIAKIIGMALFARIFNLTKPALMQFKWFAWVYTQVMLYRNRIHEYLDNWVAYQNMKLRVKEWKKAFTF